VELPTTGGGAAYYEREGERERERERSEGMWNE